MIAARTARLALVASLATACDDAAPPAPEPPAGTALLVEGVPIATADVDRWLDVIRLVEPSATRPHARRLALVNIELPRVVGSLIDPARREQARTAAERLRARLAGGGSDPSVEHVQGSWRDLGLDVWALGLDRPPGEWSEVVETGGAFVVFRTLEAPQGRESTTTLEIERALVPYLDAQNARELIESAFDQTTLTVVDPAWAEIVPEHYKYRMGAAAGGGAGR